MVRPGHPAAGESPHAAACETHRFDPVWTPGLWALGGPFSDPPQKRRKRSAGEIGQKGKPEPEKPEKYPKKGGARRLESSTCQPLV